MKILILRTIAHTRIWESSKTTCHYDTLGYNIIKTWEPNYADRNLSDVAYAIGIYGEQYYQPSYSTGITAYSNRPEEEHPSILILNPITEGSSHYATDNGKKINVQFSFVKKLCQINRQKMHQIDKQLIKKKLEELKQNPTFTKFPSLSFTLDEYDVKKVFSDFELNLDL